jgi:hypothetical protein
MRQPPGQWPHVAGRAAAPGEHATHDARAAAWHSASQTRAPRLPVDARTDRAVGRLRMSPPPPPWRPARERPSARHKKIAKPQSSSGGPGSLPCMRECSHVALAGMSAGWPPRAPWHGVTGAITTNLFTRACPSPAPAPPTPLSRKSCGALTHAKSARRATSSSPSHSLRQGWGAGTA